MPLLKSFILHFSITLVLTIMIKFPYNTRSDWLKQRALSVSRVRVDDIRFAFKFLLRNLKNLTCFIREQYTAAATFTLLESKVWFENSANEWENYWILYHNTNKEASTVLPSVKENT